MNASSDSVCDSAFDPRVSCALTVQPYGWHHMPWARQRLESAITDDILRWNRVGGISMRRLFLGTAALLAAARLLCAQEYRATITGTITDASGASVPGAQVSAGNLQNGLT